MKKTESIKTDAFEESLLSKIDVLLQEFDSYSNVFNLHGIEQCTISLFQCYKMYRKYLEIHISNNKASSVTSGGGSYGLS